MLSKKHQAKGWQTFLDDTDGLWFRRRSEHNTLQYLFASVTDMDDACGKDNLGQPRYCWEACLVDLSELDPEEQQRAVSSGIGAEGLEEVKERFGLQGMLDAIAEACFSYGSRAPLESGVAKQFDHARARAISACEESCVSEGVLADRLSQTVNKIGSTGYDFLKGDSLGGLRRSAEAVQAGEPISQEASIMLKMFAASKGQTLGAGVEKELAEAGEEIKRSEAQKRRGSTHV